MSEEKQTVHFKVSEDGEGNVHLDISGKGGELVQVLASVIDDDPGIKQLFEFALMMVDMKQKAELDGESDSDEESTFFNPPTAEA